MIQNYSEVTQRYSTLVRIRVDNHAPIGVKTHNYDMETPSLTRRLDEMTQDGGVGKLE